MFHIQSRKCGRRWFSAAALFLSLLFVAALLASLVAAASHAQEARPQATSLGTEFTYQGQLQSNGTPYTGACDLRFGLWDALSGGAQIGGTQTKTNVNLAEGYFTVQLDFGAGVFQGDARWLAIEVQCPTGTGGYTALSPRQPLTPTPYALYARGAWQTTGNTGTTPGAHFLGTTDNKALELKVNGQRALRLEPSPITGAGPNVVGGYVDNTVTNGVFAATIGGGGAGGNHNRVTDSYGTVGGGFNNQAGNNAGTTTDARNCTVAGGTTNTASGNASAILGGGLNRAAGELSTVGGGYQNSADGFESFIGGGYVNAADGNWATVSGGWTNRASGEAATLGGGYGNTASGPRATVSGGEGNSASGPWSIVGGGQGNTASLDHATVAGGEDNKAGRHAAVGGGASNEAGGTAATVGGGWLNTANGSWGTVPGGSGNKADGTGSFAAGHWAWANATGCFVWGDFTESDTVTCSQPNRTIFRSSGGFYIYTNAEMTEGMYLPAGGDQWEAFIPKAQRENSSPVNSQALLETLASLTVQEYNLKSQDSSIRHIGLLAEDFATLGYGESNTAINMQDANGVALAAIQALYAQNQELKAQNAAQQAQLDDLAARVAALETGSAHASRLPFGWLPLSWLALGGLIVVGGTVSGWRRLPGGRR